MMQLIVVFRNFTKAPKKFCNFVFYEKARNSLLILYFAFLTNTGLFCVSHKHRAPCHCRGFVDITNQQWDAKLCKSVLFYPIIVKFVSYKIIYKPINDMHNPSCINYYLILKVTHYKNNQISSFASCGFIALIRC